MRRLPTRAQLHLTDRPVPEHQRASVTAAALRATVADWQEDGEPGGRTLAQLAAAAQLPLERVEHLLGPGGPVTVPAGTAARLLWALGEPLRLDLRQALAQELADDRAA